MFYGEMKMKEIKYQFLFNEVIAFFCHVAYPSDFKGQS